MKFFEISYYHSNKLKLLFETGLMHIYVGTKPKQ